MTRILVVAGQALWLVNSRGPLLEEMIARGLEVHAAGPRADADSRAVSLASLVRAVACVHQGSDRGTGGVFRCTLGGDPLGSVP